MLLTPEVFVPGHEYVERGLVYVSLMFREPCWPADEPSPVKVLGLPLTPEIHRCSATALKTVMCDDRPAVTVGSGLQDRPLVHLSRRSARRRLSAPDVSHRMRPLRCSAYGHTPAGDAEGSLDCMAAWLDQTSTTTTTSKTTTTSPTTSPSTTTSTTTTISPSTNSSTAAHLLCV
ncbi:unnamed protein product [Gadus morhua 'NCC']